MKYFHHAEAELFGHPCRISRTGYSGERGYEVIRRCGPCRGHLALKLAVAGVMPCSFTALDKVRIEAGLLFYGYDMTTDNTPWEVGLGFTVNRTKADFRGKAALMASEVSPKVRNVGTGHCPCRYGRGRRRALPGWKGRGRVNSPSYSHRLGKSLALGHISPDIAEGTVLALKGGDIDTTATVVAMPVYNPSKSRTHA